MPIAADTGDTGLSKQSVDKVQKADHVCVAGIKPIMCMASRPSTSCALPSASLPSRTCSQSMRRRDSRGTDSVIASEPFCDICPIEECPPCGRGGRLESV